MHVLLGTERFSSRHSWSELAALIPAALSAAVDVQWCAPGAFADRARSESIDVVVPLFSELDAQTIRAGQFGLIQQFGAGVENIDIEAATSAGVWVANMPGLPAERGTARAAGTTPSPTMQTVLPASASPGGSPQCPARKPDGASGSRRRRASSSSTACSATSTALSPGMLATQTPAEVAAAMSMFSTPSRRGCCSCACYSEVRG